MTRQEYLESVEFQTILLKCKFDLCTVFEVPARDILSMYAQEAGMTVREFERQLHSYQKGGRG